MPVPSESLVTLESHLTQRLLDFERLDEAWPKGRTALERAWIPRVGSPAIDTARAEACNAAMKRVTAFARELRVLAEQGRYGAQYNLGFMYSNGQGVPQDAAEAVKWYRKAAEQGDADAQNNLGVMYDKGRSVTQNYVQAHMWYNLAAAGLPPGEDRDLAAKGRDIVAKRMTPAQIAEAQRLAREWKPRRQSGAAPDN